MALHPLISMPGVWELLLILVIVLIFFGVGKLPEIGRALGSGIRNFRDAQGDVKGKGLAGHLEDGGSAEEARKVEDAEEVPRRR